MRKLKNSELERISVENFKSSDKTSIVIVLDNVRSALNVGSAFRTADAFLIEKIYLCGICATPPNNDIRKSALGSTESVDWEKIEKTEEVIQKLKQKGYKVVAIEQTENASLLNNFSSLNKNPIAIVFGHEINGVSQSVLNLCDESIEIPQFGTKHSLNISVSLGIVVWELWKQINK